MWISRHGTASDEDEVVWNNFDCGETVNQNIFISFSAHVILK